MPNITDMSSLKLAYAAQQLKGDLDILRAEPIAIIGMGCRFPGKSNSLEEYWRLLQNGDDGIVEMPAGRFDMARYFDTDPQAAGKFHCRHGGFLADVDLFDARLFNISPKEARAMDPQQRLLLEVAWEALADAALQTEALYGSDTGVFAGISTFDYATIQVENAQAVNRIDPYFVSGTVLSVAAGRLAYVLGLKGPCLSVDTACSSSLVSTHLACESLRRRECSLAIAGGVGLLLSPHPYISFCKAGMLAPDGRCKTFDQSADGYVRGEGCGVLVLKRLSDALAEGNPVWAVIRGSALNQDGASGGLTVPSGPSQEAVMLAALQNSGIRPETVDYIEAHGTGTRLGDPIELTAIGNVYGANGRTQPLIVGSAKTNFGHLEAAAGVAGIIKVALAFANNQIPPHLHFQTPTPQFDWHRFQLTVPTKLRPWPETSGPQRAGVSSFGFCGTNAHILMESYTYSGSPKRPAAPYRFNHERYWAEPTAGRQPEQNDDLPGRRLNLPFSKEIRFECHLSETWPPYVKDHRLFDTVVMAGASHLAMILEGITQIWGNGPCLMEDVMMHHPLRLQSNEQRLVQLVFTPQDDNVYRFQLISASVPESSAPDNNAWQIHATGQTRPAPETDCKADTDTIPGPIDGARLISGEELYQRVTQSGHWLGDTFRWFREGSLNGRRISSRFSSPSPAAANYRIHPGLFDACFQLFCIYGPGMMFPATADELAREAILVPFSFERILFQASRESNRDLFCTLDITDGDVQQQHLIADFDLRDDTGRLLLEAAGFQIRRLDRNRVTARDEKPSPEIYRLAWEPPQFDSTEKKERPALHWLILADRKGRGDLLGRHLKERGHTVDLAYDTPHTPSIETFQKHLTEPTQLYDCIAYTRAMDIPPEPSLENCLQPLEQIYMDMLILLQALNQPAEAQVSTVPPRLYLLTQVGWASNGNLPPLNPFQAPLWGLGRVASLEIPELKCILVDWLDSELSPACLDQLLLAPPGSELSIKDNHCRIARLTRESGHPVPEDSVTSQKTYLITGGTGAIGMEIFKHLVAKGARYFVIAGRRPPGTAASDYFKMLKQEGVQLTISQCDISQKKSVQALLETIPENYPPLGGIVHAAGVVDDALIMHQDLKRFKTVMASKISGAWHLHTLTQNRNLDFMVFCSSISSLLGSQGQANYAAANAFMDGLAHLQNAMGRPGVSINWAGWAGTGMAAALSSSEQEKLRLSGIGMLAKDQALKAMDKVLAMNVPQAAVLAIDWEIYGSGHPCGPVPEPLRRVIGSRPLSQPSTRGQNNTKLANLLEKTDKESRPALLEQYLWQTVAELLGLAPETPPDLETGLFDLGMDSIMAVQLKDQLAIESGRPIRSTLVFNYPTISAMSGYIMAHVLPEYFNPLPGKTETKAETAWDDLSEKEWGDLLDQKLSKLDRWIT